MQPAVCAGVCPHSRLTETLTLRVVSFLKKAPLSRAEVVGIVADVRDRIQQDLSMLKPANTAT